MLNSDVLQFEHLFSFGSLIFYVPFQRNQRNHLKADFKGTKCHQLKVKQNFKTQICKNFRV